MGDGFRVLGGLQAGSGVTIVWNFSAGLIVAGWLLFVNFGWLGC